MGRRKVLTILLLWAACVAPGAGLPAAETAEGITSGGGKSLIGKFTLGNGLTVVFRENHSSPVVRITSYNVCYTKLLRSVLLVVEEGKTKSDELKHAASLLKDINVLGTVFNKSTDHKISFQD